MKAMTTTLSAVAVAALAGTASANIVLNGGFENGTGADAADWNEIAAGASGSVERSSGMPNSGNWAAYMSVDNVNNPAAPGAYFIEQNQPVGSITGGASYDLSFSAKVDSTDFTGIDVFVQILFLDQDGSNGGGVQNEVLTSLVGLGINENYQTFNINGLTAAAGADSFLLRFQLASGPVDGVQNGFWVDDVALTPTPAAAGLLGLAGIAAARRRR